MVLLRSGKDTEFNGGRTADEIVQWITKKTGPAAIPVKTIEEAKAQIDGNSVVAFGFFKDFFCEEALRFTEAAEASELTYIITNMPIVANEYGVEFPALVVYTDFDEKKFTYDGSFIATEISNFVAGSSLPLVTEFSEEVSWCQVPALCSLSNGVLSNQPPCLVSKSKKRKKNKKQQQQKKYMMMNISIRSFHLSACLVCTWQQRP